MNKIKQNIIVAGLVGLISLASMNCGRGRDDSTGHLTGNRVYARSATIQYDENLDEYKSSEHPQRTVIIFDLDGKRNLDNKLDADEVLVYNGNGRFVEWFVHFMDVDINQWKHYVAPGAKNLLIANNITPMTAEQRALYSGILNADPLEEHK